MTDLNTGCLKLCEYLKVNTGLTSLDLGCNNITKKGGLALKQAILYNENLRTLNLHGNTMPNELIEEMKKILSGNTIISSILYKITDLL